MTRLDADASEVVEAPPRSVAPRSILLESREVPLGGVRAMEVHRTLPQRDLPMVGAWCFLDRFGPQTARMRVEPHPHIGLQTVTWPFVGEVRHRDSIGSDVVVRGGALNLMTSGAGISHSEYSVGDGEVPLDALQLWVALPEARRHGAPAFERHEDLPVIELPASAGPDAAAIVVLGELAGVASPASVHTPIVGAEVRVPAGTRVRLPLRPEWEHAIVGVDGTVLVADALAVDPPVVERGSEATETKRADPSQGGDPPVVERGSEATETKRADPSQGGDTAVGPQQLLYLGVARDGIELSSEEGATVFLLGGEPFEDDIVMWWNFVARTHEEIVAARDEWEARSTRFGMVDGHGGVRIPAPPLPAVRLTARRRRL